MGYSNFKKLKTVTKKFGLDAWLISIFPQDIESINPSEWLQETLEIARIMPLMSGKSKSERVISPILMELAKHYKTEITLFSGEDLILRPEDDLSGECDFFFSLHPPKPYIDLPIISLVEAKNEDLEWGLGQCAAQVYGAYLYNQQEDNNMPILYGCTTTGSDWQFFKLENGVFYIHSKIMTDLPQVLGTWHWILTYYIDNFSKK